MANKKKEIDWNLVGEYLHAQCKTVDIADLLGVSTDMLYVRCKQDLGMDFSVFAQQKRASGKELLRKKQFDTAMEGNVSMQIWLGKQYLEQADKSQVENKGNIKIDFTND